MTSSRAATEWLSSSQPNTYYVDIILYAQQPIYLKANELTGTAAAWDLYNNAYSAPVSVITISRTVATDSFMAIVRKVASTTVSKPNDFWVRNPPVLDAIKMEFSSADSLGRYIYQQAIGYFVAITVRQGNEPLRSPTWSGEYDYSDYDAETNEWGLSSSKVPFTPKPIVGTPEVYEKNFRFIADVLNDVSSVAIRSNEKDTTVVPSLFKVVVVYNPRTPWLNNPPTWSN